MAPMEQATEFVRIHTWMPLVEAQRLALLKHEECVPFCTECADWHFDGEEHSSV